MITMITVITARLMHSLVIGKADKTPSQIAMLAIFIRQAVEEMTP